jgi:hypothetical protein
MHFGRKAASAAKYVCVRPSATHKAKAPNEPLYRCKRDVSYLRVYASPAYVLVSETKRTKQESRSAHGVSLQ